MNKKQHEYFNNLKNKNVHILGFLGRESFAILNCLYNKGVQNITAHDFTDKNDAQRKFNLIQTALTQKEQEKNFKELLKQKVNLCYKNNYLEGINEADVVYVSQNWYTYKINKPLTEELEKREIQLTNLMDMYFNLCEFPIIGITGSNGKTTTTNIVYQLLKECTNKKVFISGNDMFAKPVIEDILDYNKEEAILVLEISNRHLKIFKHKPHISIITNLSKNHLSEHGGWKGYVRDKANIFRYMNSGYTILNNDDGNTSLIINDVKNTLVLFSKNRLTEGIGTYIDDKKICYKDNENIVELCSMDDIKIQGEHNLENSLAALTVVKLMCNDLSKIPFAISNYKPVKERLQFVTTFNGVTYYNDISCTTPQSAEYALKTLYNGKRNIIHIIGGDDKEMEFDSLNKLINNIVKKVLAFPGTGTNKITDNINPDLVENFTDINKALEYIFNITEDGDIVLLSPALAFFKREYIEPKKFDDYVFEMIRKKENN